MKLKNSTFIKKKRKIPFTTINKKNNKLIAVFFVKIKQKNKNNVKLLVKNQKSIYNLHLIFIKIIEQT